MKFGAKDSRKGRSLIITASVAALTLAALQGCGKPDDESAGAVAGGASDQQVMRGFAAFGNQCASGFNTDPKAVKLELWGCPTGLPVVELAEPIQPLYFNVDCSRKEMTIRSYDKSIDVTWQLMPDGSFYITQEGLNAKLKDDGKGNRGCVTPLSMDLWGKVECNGTGANRDKATIKIETVMWMGRQPTPGATNGVPAPSATPSILPNNPTTPTPSARPSGRPVPAVVTEPAPMPAPAAAGLGGPKCQLPSDKCYFHAITTINQCS